MVGAKTLVAYAVRILKLDRGIVESDVDSLEDLLRSFEERVKSCNIQTSAVDITEVRSSRKPVGAYLLKFVKYCGLILSKLSNELASTEGQNELGAEEAGDITFLLQFILKFGVLPHLETGVRATEDETPTNFFDCFTPREKYTHLCEAVCNIFVTCKNSPIIRSLVVRCLLTNVIAALMQICFSPTSARILDIARRQECMRPLNEIIETWVPKTRLLQEVLILQGNISTRIAPNWMQKKCGTILSRTLLEKDGFKSVILSMVANLNGAQPGDTKSWEEIVALASVLSTLPSKGTTAEKYCELACPQLIDLLISARKHGSEWSGETVRIVCTTLRALHEKYPSESRIFEKVICKPLSGCCCNVSSGEEILGDVSDVDLSDCIESLHQICVSVGVAPDSLLSMLVKPYLKVLFLLLCHAQETSSHLKSLSSELMTKFLNGNDRGRAADLILMLCSRGINQMGFKTPFRDLRFQLSEDGNISPVIKRLLDPSEILCSQDTKVKVLIDIILNCNMEGIVGEVFLNLFNSLCDPGRNEPSQLENANCIFTADDKAINALESNEERFITFGLLTSLCETVSPSKLLSNPSQMFDFVKTMLENLIGKVKDGDVHESLSLCVSVLGICLATELNSTQREELSKIVPVLQRFSAEKNLNTKTKELISDLVIAISTYGAVNETSFEIFSKTMREQLGKFEEFNKRGQTTHGDGNANNKTEEYNEKSTDGEDETCESVSFINQHRKSGINALGINSNIEQSFEEALDEVFDTSPVIKGGAIRYLTKCIQQKVPASVQNLNKLVKIFMECLDHEESFVYLSAVQGLAVVATAGEKNISLGDFLERIVARFLGPSDIVDSAQEIELKMKLGEVVMRIIRETGDLGPRYASVLLPEFLRGARHPNADMRASCLSNFAALAPLAPHYLTQIQQEVRECLCNASKSDADRMVRRSAVHAIRELVNKLGPQILNILPDVVKDFYRTLKLLYQSDKDNTVRLHAQLALEDLDEIMRASIFKPVKLSKKITVLPSEHF